MSNGSFARNEQRKIFLPSNSSTTKSVNISLNTLFGQTKDAYEDDNIFEDDEEIRLKAATGREIVNCWNATISLTPARIQRYRV